MRSRLSMFVMLLMVAALVLGACAPAAAPGAAPSADRAAAPAAASDAPIELRIAWWGSQNRHDRTIAVIEMFEQMYPNIDIVYEFAGWGDYWTLMSTQAAGGNLPDIVQQDYARLDEWVSRGLLAPLDEYVADGTIDFSNVSEASLAGGRIDGKLYGVNLGTNSMVIVIDADKLAEAGLEVPSPEWTFSEFEQLATELHNRLGIYGFSGALTNDQLWKNIYLSLGQWVYSEDGASLGYEDDQPFMDYLSMVKRLQDAGVTQSREQELAAGGSVETDLIVTGQSAMTFLWSNQIVALTTAAGEGRNFILHPMPRPEGGASANYYKPSMFFSITSQARHPKEAAMFIDFFTNNVEANQILLAERGVPVSSEVRTALEPMLGVAQKQMFDYIASLESSVSPIPPPDVTGHTNFLNNVYWPLVIDPFMFGQISVEEAARIMRTEGNIVLAESVQ